MALINWSANYSVGSIEIDTQHQKLIALINTLHEGKKAGSGKEILLKVLDELANYSVYHCSTEEKLFELHKYPDRIKHKKEHNELVLKVTEFKESYFNGNSLLSLELMNFLRDWLINHIAKSDKDYTAFFIEKGVFVKI